MSQNIVAAGSKARNQLNSSPQLRIQANQGHFQNSTSFNQNISRTGRSSSSKSSTSNNGFRFLKLGSGLSSSSLDTQVDSLNGSNFIRNSLDSAHNIGNFSGNNRYSWKDSLDANNSSDYYQLSITNTTLVNASLANASGNTTLQLLKANGSAVKSAAQNGKISSRLRSGTYYMQVSGDGNDDYTLNLKGTGIANDAGSRPQAALDAGNLSRSDRTFKRMIGGKDRDDVYQFTLSEGSNVEFALGNLSKDASLQLLDSSGNEIAKSNNPGSTGESLSESLGQGTYYVKVSTTSKSAMRYALEMSTGTLGAIDTNTNNNNGTNSGNSSGNSSGNNNGNNNGNSGGSSNNSGGSSSSGSTKGNYYLKLTRTYSKESNGLEDLNLALMQGNQVVDKVIAVSGQPGKQYFRKAGDSISGSMEPLPEGKWSLGSVEWASGGKGSYSGTWGEGLGPVWVSVNPEMYTQRSEIGIHWDYNASYSPGTSGCIGITNKSDLQKVVSWFDNSLTTPKETIVDWGLGTV
jgi:Bacterial pre-peptidase C-terminal domain